MACDCSVVRVLLGADSAVIDVGRSTRKISAALRRGIKARDGGCRWPGCGRPACWSEAHHLQHWIDGGATELDNLVLLCYHHHRKVHEGGWQLVKCDDGRLLTIAPPMRFGRWSRGPD
jgi:HNH endonuclease